MTRDWMGLQELKVEDWHQFNTVKEWWTAVGNIQATSRKAILSLPMLVLWEIWQERNARVFRHSFSMPSVVFCKVKLAASLWGFAGAKALSSIMPRE